MGFQLDSEQYLRIQGKNATLWGRGGAMVLSELRAHVVNVQWQYRLQCHHDLWLLQQSNGSPSEVVQWSNHRVMEWLRSVDLAEYAPNLRGSGVHGALIVRLLHICFNALLHIHRKLTDCNIKHVLPGVCPARGNKIHLSVIQEHDQAL